MVPIKLSEIFLNGCNTKEDVVNYCLDRRANSIINDISPKPWVEYGLDDLEYVWKNLKRLNNADKK